MKVILRLWYQCAEDDNAAALQEALEGMTVVQREALRVVSGPENHRKALF
jgi:hypothetical protein